MDKPADAALKRAIGMLEAILRREIDIHREMLTVAEAKRDSIIQGNIAKLESAVADEKNLVARIEDEENKRVAVMPLVKNGLGLATEVEKMREVILAMPEPERTRLMTVRDELKRIMEENQLKARANAELLKASLEHLDSFMRSLNDAAHKDGTYKRDGRKAGGGPSIIDRRG